MLEVEEGEHRSTGELVLELKEVGEEVQDLHCRWWNISRGRWSSLRRSLLSWGAE